MVLRKWSFPSKKQCFSCHTDNENSNLGIEVNQALPEGISESYLHYNCSGCNNPSTNTPSKIDFRYKTAFNDMNICDVAAEHEFNDEVGLKILDPENKDNSAIYKRLNTVGDGQMPPLGRHQIDMKAVQVIGNWIDEIVSCDN